MAVNSSLRHPRPFPQLRFASFNDNSAFEILAYRRYRFGFRPNAEIAFR
jgi:hypothetical protein